jgi:hypothetical protein
VARPADGRFNRTDELNDRITAFIDARSEIRPSTSGS